MTLAEILIVLALLVLVGSIVVPVFTGSFSSVRLRRAGDQVLTSWAHARARAIETGDVFQFTYTPDSGAYSVGPWTPLADAAAGGASSATPSRRAARSSTAAASADDAAGRQRNLPPQITFKSGQIAVEDAVSGARQVTTTQSTGESTSTPILFFPDGTSSQASVALANDRRQFVRLTLRGLTGIGRASDVLTLDELQRTDRRR